MTLATVFLQSASFLHVLYIIAFALFIYGLSGLTGPRTAVRGNRIAAVGMAIAERWLGSYFNRPDFDVVDWRTWVFCGDGDMMEGISSEAGSLAGHLGLHKLCWIYDSNRTSIEGRTDITFTEDVATRFLGFGWNVLHVRDANNEKEVIHAFDLAQSEDSRPTLIVVESHIGYGSPHKQDSAEAHGEPLGQRQQPPGGDAVRA